MTYCYLCRLNCLPKLFIVRILYCLNWSNYLCFLNISYYSRVFHIIAVIQFWIGTTDCTIREDGYDKKHFCNITDNKWNTAMKIITAAGHSWAVLETVAAEGVSGGGGANEVQTPHNVRRPPPPKKTRRTFYSDVAIKIVPYCRKLY